MAEYILEMRDIIKEFPGVKALNEVNLQVQRGEIHALVGENGAGKSTLMNVLSGIYPHGSYEGDILYEGKTCAFKTIKDSENAGIVIIHQELALVPFLSIGENMFLGNECGAAFNVDWDETFNKATQLLHTVGLQENPNVLVKDIGVGKQQLVEIAKALAKDVKLLILDEPTASLNEADSQALLDLLLKFKEQGMTSIIISHKLNEISYVADKITVIRDGTTIETLARGKDDFSEERVVKGMVGREMSDRFPKRTPNIGDVALEISDWTVYHPAFQERKVVDNVSLHVRRGEVVGIAGLMGAGRTELAMSIFGQSYGANCSGTLKLNGETLHLKSVRQAINAKIAYVTEDRKGNGLILSNPIRINTTLAALGKVSHHNVLDTEREMQVAEEYRTALKTKCASVEQAIGNLSGGNQQKVLLAKWMFTDPKVLILDEPTRGIDIGAKYEIYGIINQLVAQGKSVIMISSELPEVLGMSDRVYVMNEGRMVAEFPIARATSESIMASILQSSGKAREEQA